MCELPVRAGKTLVGAVGVSGTPGSAGGGEGDAKCGQAGIDSIGKGLAAGADPGVLPGRV